MCRHMTQSTRTRTQSEPFVAVSDFFALVCESPLANAPRPICPARLATFFFSENAAAPLYHTKSSRAALRAFHPGWSAETPRCEMIAARTPRPLNAPSALSFETRAAELPHGRFHGAPANGASKCPRGARPFFYTARRPGPLLHGIVFFLRRAPALNRAKEAARLSRREAAAAAASRRRRHGKRREMRTRRRTSERGQMASSRSTRTPGDAWWVVLCGGAPRCRRARVAPLRTAARRLCSRAKRWPTPNAPATPLPLFVTRVCAIAVRSGRCRRLRSCRWTARARRRAGAPRQVRRAFPVEGRHLGVVRRAAAVAVAHSHGTRA